MSRAPDATVGALIYPGTGLFSTGGCPPSIVGAEAFHFRVRDGNGWVHLALSTRNIRLFGGSSLVVGRWGSPERPIPNGERITIGSGGGIRTHDLRVMSPTSCHCSTPRRCAPSQAPKRGYERMRRLRQSRAEVCVGQALGH